VIIAYLLSVSAMSSQKLPDSYSSLRRQIKAQVAAHMNFITNSHDDVDDDNNDYDMENECEQPCDSVTFPVFETNGGCNSAGVSHVAQSCYSVIGDKPFLWSKPKLDPP